MRRARRDVSVEQRHHQVREQTERDAGEEPQRDGQRRGHAPVPHVVTDVGGDATERAGTEVEDARRPVDEHDPEGDQRGERSGRGPEQHEAQRRLAPQRRSEHHDAFTSLPRVGAARREHIVAIAQ